MLFSRNIPPSPSPTESKILFCTSVSLFLFCIEETEKEIKETIPFTNAMKRIKYLGISLPKETKDLHTENYETLMKEIKDDKNR